MEAPTLAAKKCSNGQKSSPEREVVQKKRKNNPGKLKEVSIGGETRESQSKIAYSCWRVDEEGNMGLAGLKIECPVPATSPCP
ncbi:hypothetical protein U1Q18_041073 [Sarracenia purpurea var. burkii]